LRGPSGSGFDDQFWQTDAVNPGILWESPHPLSIVGVEYKDEEGGTGAKFIVVWQADVPVNPPLVESVNAHFTGTQLTVFTSRGQPIK